MKWRKSGSDKMEVAWPSIEKELKTIGTIDSRNILDINHVEFIVNGVKFSFYACNRYSPITTTIKLKNNLQLADLVSIGAMKMEVMMRRSNFRDYYDIYSILHEGCDINELITLALKYSGHRMKTKNLLAMLTNGNRFSRDSQFEQLQPKYNVSVQDIENYIREKLVQ